MRPESSLLITWLAAAFICATALTRHCKSFFDSLRFRVSFFLAAAIASSFFFSALLATISPNTSTSSISSTSLLASSRFSGRSIPIKKALSSGPAAAAWQVTRSSASARLAIRWSPAFDSHITLGLIGIGLTVAIAGCGFSGSFNRSIQKMKPLSAVFVESKAF